jgi:hypothetical protein
MRFSLGLIAAMTLFCTGPALCEPYYASNGADFLVPADELDAVVVEQAAQHAGFFAVPETDPKLKALRKGPNAVYEIWEPRSRKIASITLTHMAKTNSFVVEFVAKDPSRPGMPLAGEACKKWLLFSAGMRSGFGNRQSKFRFHAPQCVL